MSGSLSQYRPSSNEAWSICDLLSAHFRAVGDRVAPAGSLAYNPHADSFGDIDIVIGATNIDVTLGMVAALFGKNKNGSARTQGIIGQTQVDLFVVENAYMGAALAFYTNPLPLQFALRAIAAARGYSLTPKGLKHRDTDKYVVTPDQESVFSRLGVDRFSNEEKQRALSYKTEKPEVMENV